MARRGGGSVTERGIKVLDQAISGDYALYHGDSIEVVQGIPENSIHYSIFSPPFASLYVYSASDRDLGNVRDHAEFFEHFRFLVGDLLRVTMPGRLLSFHCMDLPTSKTRDGWIGLTDFRGDLIRLFVEAGWILHSQVCIWKDPVTAMQRTKALGLLHKQLKKDSCMSRQGIPDYLVTLRKPGENPERVSHTNETFPVEVWQRYASPVWMDIDPSDTLQFRSARENEDERHICPLQLGVVRRAIELWTNPGDRVLSPFAGIGSEGYVALEMSRRFIGCELKRSYFEQAARNLQAAKRQIGLFDAEVA
jgi:DNA modification methylase